MSSSFCRNMRNRSYQYMIRSTYDLFKKDPVKKKKIETIEIKEVKQPKEKKKKIVNYGVDKNGVKYAGHTFAVCDGEELQIISATAKMVILSNGKRKRMSSVEFKHAYEVDNWWEKEVINFY